MDLQMFISNRPIRMIFSFRNDFCLRFFTENNDVISFSIVVIRHVDCTMAPPTGWNGSELSILVIKCDKSMMSIPFPLHISRVALQAQYYWNGLLCLFTCLCLQSGAKQVLRNTKHSICGCSAIRDSLRNAHTHLLLTSEEVRSKTKHRSSKHKHCYPPLVHTGVVTSDRIKHWMVP